MSKPFATSVVSGIFNFDYNKEEVRQPEKVVVNATPQYGDEECDHGFLVTDHDDVGNIYLCRVCDKRFASHPGDEKPSFEDVEHTHVTLTKFREGLLTLSETIERTRMSCEQMKEVLTGLFPPTPILSEQRTIGSSLVAPVVVDYEPQRESSYQEVDRMFSSQDVHPSVMVAKGETFFDIDTISYYECQASNQYVITVDFVDGSSQKVLRDIREGTPFQ